jgi:tetratricopeptide (TPR) repeat protein
MGKLILCSGSRTKRPFVFQNGGSRVYSIEELCYYIGSHIYFIDEDTFSYELIDWIKTELGLDSRAEKLKLMKDRQADVKTLLTAVLCSADYYTEQEIKKLIRVIDELNGMSPIKKSCLRADNYLKSHRYNEAAGEYDQILNSKDAGSMTPEEYGDILHNLAVARIHTKGLYEASELFRQAYERNQREESLRQYLFTLCMSNNKKLFQDRIEEYQVRQALVEDILWTMEQMESQAQDCEGMSEFMQLKRWRAEGRMPEYHKKLDDMLEGWIAEVRKI